jgi:site-specific DNA-methyltransferase (adenine-specific)
MIIILITEIKPYKNNPRINDGAVDAVAASIKEFGFRVPIIVDADNVIVAGHTRLKAAQKLGLSEVPVIVADDLTPEQVRAFRLADNKVGEIAEWDFEKLEEELKSLNIDMSQFGFDIAEDVSGGEVIEDDFDVDKAIEEIDEPTTKRGDIWTLGDHRLMCGDCRNKNEVAKLMQGNFADMVVTDPPYNMAYEGAGGTSDAKRKTNRIMNDKMSGADFELFLSGFYSSLYDTLKEQGTFYVFYKELGEGVFISELKKSGLNFKQELVWVKNQLVLGGQKYQNMYEPVLFGYKGKTPATWNGRRNQTSVIEDINLMNEIELREAIRELIEKLETDVVRERKPLKNDLHPTMKPIKLLARFIRNSSNASDVVLDFFGGSGSTLIACEQLGRKCYTMELDPKYCDVIVKRWEQLTGNKAILN